MRILILHNRYQQPGGEDQVFEAEAALLSRFGHYVKCHEISNDAVAGMGKLALAACTIWNPSSYKAVRRTIQEHRPDILHCHNTFPLFSPSVYYAAQAERVPVVQTLHNYRLLCPGSTLYRQGQPCELCLHRTLAWPAVRHSCYRDDRAASAVTAMMLAAHHLAGTWRTKVQKYITLTTFARNKFLEAGFPADRIVVKPNFIDPDPGIGPADGQYALFVGRLTGEKGILTLIGAWRHGGIRMPLKIAGDGPLRSVVLAAADGLPIEFLGHCQHARVIDLMHHATMLIVPSMWYEGFPLTVVEAFACGVPVVASRLGSLAAVIQHGKNGLHFQPGDAGELISTVEQLSNDAAMADRLRRQAHMDFGRLYSAEVNYRQLIAAYQDARIKRSVSNLPS